MRLLRVIDSLNFGPSLLIDAPNWRQNWNPMNISFVGRENRSNWIHWENKGILRGIIIKDGNERWKNDLSNKYSDDIHHRRHFKTAQCEELTAKHLAKIKFSFVFFFLPSDEGLSLTPLSQLSVLYSGEIEEKRVQTSPGNSWLLCEINLHIAENVLWNIERGFKGWTIEWVPGAEDESKLLLVRRHKRIRMNRFPYANIYMRKYFF